MKIAFCDDDAAYLEEIEDLLSAYAGERPDHNISYHAFAYTDDILDASAKIGGFDLYILDIVMQNDITGIALGVKLRQAGYDGKIVYLTSSAEYAIDSFKVKPFHYMMKPIEKDALFAILDEAYEIISHEISQKFMVKTKENSLLLSYDSILYAELVKRTAVFRLVGGKTVESTTLRTTFSEAMAELTSDSRFMIRGSGMLVNLHHVTSVGNDSIVFRNGQTVYLGKKLCRDMRSAWNEFWFKERSRV